jgi:hypothetical protein
MGDFRPYIYRPFIAHPKPGAGRGQAGTTKKLPQPHWTVVASTALNVDPYALLALGSIG